MSNSYGSLAEVVALTRVYLQGAGTFNTTTTPTGTEVQKFLDRASGVLNLALSTAGFTIPVSQADAKLACDDWVVGMAAAYVEASQPFTGTDAQENPRAGLFSRLAKQAGDFVKANAAGFAMLGVERGGTNSNALTFTGLAAEGDRSDPQNDALAQPKFRRSQFDSRIGSDLDTTDNGG